MGAVEKSGALDFGAVLDRKWRSNVNYSHFLFPVSLVLASWASLKGESK